MLTRFRRVAEWSALLVVLVAVLACGKDGKDKAADEPSGPAPLLVETARRSIFAPNSAGVCPSEQDVTYFCQETMCVIWQNGASPAPDAAVMDKYLSVLERYVDLGIRVMDYTPTPHDPPVVGSDGRSRSYIVEINEALCPGYGGAGYNGRSWVGTSKPYFKPFLDTYGSEKPTVHQVYFYEMGRNLYDPKLDTILDWELDAARHGFWTLGFNGAMTVLAPEALGTDMDFNGQGLAAFRAQRLKDLQTYVDDKALDFDNTWSVYLLPWTAAAPNKQSVNDMMSGLLILMSDRFGGLDYLRELFVELKKQPATPLRTDRKERAKNLYLAARAAAVTRGVDPAEIDTLFKMTLRWSFLP